MREWYNGYRFAKNATGDLYNTDMVLYFLKHSIPNEPMPDDLIDTNVRIDYTKLRHLLLVNQRASAEARRLNGNFDLLRHPHRRRGDGGRPQLELPPGGARRAGELPLPAVLLRPAEHPRGVRGHDPAGDPQPDGVAADVRIPARRVSGRGGVLGEPPPLLAPGAGMAYKGEWRPAVEYIAAAIAEQTGIRDYIDGEKVVQAFLAAHFSVVGQFLIHSERELNKGYADLHLEPFVAQYPDIAYGYVIEVKYLKRSERVDDSVVAETVRGAQEQLAGYLADEGLRRRAPAVRYVGLAVVFHGWELAACEAVDQ